MKSFKLCFLILLLGLFAGCESDSCEEVACGPGDCVEGICDCPDGFTGANCEIELCFGVQCVNGDCDLQNETCNCDPNYYGEKCTILCANGEFANGVCTCSEGYEGATCEIESRDHFLGWWTCSEWIVTSKKDAPPIIGDLPGTIKFECGNTVPEIHLFPTENSSGLLLLSSDEILVGRVTGKTIHFENQYLTNEVSVSGSAILESEPIFRIELVFSNSTTSLTQKVSARFTLARLLKHCNG